MTNIQSQLAMQRALIDARRVAAGPEAGEKRLERAQEAEQPQGARDGESRYRVSMRAEVGDHCPECGRSSPPPYVEQQFERTVWAPTRREASERAMDLIIGDHSPAYVETTDVTKVTEPVPS